MKRMGRPTEPTIEKANKSFNHENRDESMADVLVELDKGADDNKRSVS